MSTKKSQPSQARRERIARVSQYALHIVLVIFFLFPLLFLFVSALKGDELQLLKDMGSLNAFVPYGDISLKNFSHVISGSNFKTAFFNSLQISAVRRHCQTMALWTGLPDVFSQSTTVSR